MCIPQSQRLNITASTTNQHDVAIAKAVIAAIPWEKLIEGLFTCDKAQPKQPEWTGNPFRNCQTVEDIEKVVCFLDHPQKNNVLKELAKLPASMHIKDLQRQPAIVNLKMLASY